MNETAKRFVLFGVVTLLCALANDQVTLRGRPGLLSAFNGWSGGGCSGTDACTVMLEGDTAVTARFRLLGLL